MKKDVVEKRRYPRVAIKAEVKAGLFHAGGIIYFSTKNISKGGAFLVSDYLFESGQELTLSFQLPGDNRIILAVGRVRWVSDKNKVYGEFHEPGMGIEFTKISPADEKRIEDFLQKSRS